MRQYDIVYSLWRHKVNKQNVYALLQRMLRWATALPQKWDLWACAHWHHYSHIEQNGQEIIVNGTLVSDDEYVRRNYGWNASTLQVLFGVHPRKNITWEYRINLKKKEVSGENFDNTQAD